MLRVIPFAFLFVTVWLANGGQVAPLAFKRDIPAAIGDSGQIAVAVGAFADPTFLTPHVSVYGSRRHLWVDISGWVRREN
jgi:hypothetical protein